MGNTISPLEVKLQAFEGPLDLLLHLIHENKIDIFNIPIAEITEKYLEYLKLMKQFDLDISGEFLVMAATLIYIKSKMLLPADEEEDDEQTGDPRAELVEKLLEYQSFKHAAHELSSLAEERQKVFTRPSLGLEVPAVTVDDSMEFSANIYDLIQAFSRVLSERSTTTVHEVFEESISIDEKIEEIERILNTKGTVLFSQLLEKNASLHQMIATFVAILECAKRKMIRLQQDHHFSDIILFKMQTP